MRKKGGGEAGGKGRLRFSRRKRRPVRWWVKEGVGGGGLKEG